MNPKKTPEERNRAILVAMICFGIVIFIADVFFSLGFVIWILYFVLLLMSVWLNTRSAPFITAWLITLAILTGSIVSGAIRQVPTDLPGRVVFIMMLAIASLLVWEIRTNYERLEAEVAERKKAQEKLEELTQSLEKRISERTRELAGTNIKLIEDIAQRHNVEASLAAANQKLSLLSQVTRHDISNRVFALLMEIDMAKAVTTDPDLLKSFERQERTSMVIQEQVEFARNYHDIGAQAPAWFPVKPIIRNTADQIETPPTVKITVDCNGVEVFVDAMISRVFYNLIHNAIRHGEHVTQITFSHHISGTDLVISCEDNGIGIALQEKEHIFKRGVGKGTGYGLFLIREILDITGITIRETGEPGKGARFEIAVPKGAWRIDDVNRNGD